MVPHCWFNWRFPDDIRCETVFLHLFTICIPSLVKTSLFNEIVFLLMNCKSSFYILNKSFIKCVFCKIFSQAVVCLLVLLAFSFMEHNLILVKSSLLITSFMDKPLVLYLKCQCQTQGHLSFLLHYFLNFIGFPFTFRSMIHFKLTFERYKVCVWSHVFVCRCPVVPALLWKRVSFLHCVGFTKDLFLGSKFCSTNHGLFFSWWDWDLNTGVYAYKAGSVPPELYRQSILLMGGSSCSQPPK